jgi:hypothetical protein
LAVARQAARSTAGDAVVIVSPEMDGCSGGFLVVALALIVGQLLKLVIRQSPSAHPSSSPPPYLAVEGKSQYQIALI